MPHATGRRSLIVALFGLLAVLAAPAAQAETARVLALGGDLYRFQNGAITRLTTYGHNSSPSVSPDGRFVAYLSAPPALVKAQTLPTYAGGVGPPMAYNIWLLDLPSLAATKLADQPANLRLLGYDDTANFIERSAPTWSGDGRALAWIEVRQPGQRSWVGRDERCQVVTYAVQTRKQTSVPLAPKGLSCLANGDALNSLSPGPGNTVYGFGSGQLAVISPTTLVTTGAEYAANTLVSGGRLFVQQDRDLLIYDAATRQVTRRRY